MFLYCSGIFLYYFRIWILFHCSSKSICRVCLQSIKSDLWLWNILIKGALRRFGEEIQTQNLDFLRWQERHEDTRLLLTINKSSRKYFSFSSGRVLVASLPLNLWFPLCRCFYWYHLIFISLFHEPTLYYHLVFTVESFIPLFSLLFRFTDPSSCLQVSVLFCVQRKLISLIDPGS